MKNTTKIKKILEQTKTSFKKASAITGGNKMTQRSLKLADAVEERRANSTVAIGGVGGDAHSVGLIVLRQALKRAGFQVRFLGTQNSVKELCLAAADSHAILVSNMDGHAHHYLADLRNQRAEYGGGSSIWYLGGNPALISGRDAERTLAALGFDRVYLGYVTPSAVIAQLDLDLAARGPANCPRQADESANYIWRQLRSNSLVHRNDVEFGPIRNDDDLHLQRSFVLGQWRTGGDARQLDKNAQNLMQNLSLAEVQTSADKEGRMLIHPRCGVADLKRQTEIFDLLCASGADVLSFQIDSLTRNNSYQEIDSLLSEKKDAAALNGFPAVNHGVAAISTLVSRYPHTPMQVRQSTRDPRLLAEISFAAGVAAFEGGAITYNLPYYRDYSPRVSLERWRYVDRLTGRYASDFGVIIDREFFGTLTATLVPPCLAAVSCVFEALLAAEQGVLSVSLGYAEQGCRMQDIAAIGALRRVARCYLDRFGFSSVAVHTVFHQFMGAFPLDAQRARKLILDSAITASWSGATRLMAKTHVEALRIPTAEENAEAVRAIRAEIAKNPLRQVDEQSLKREEDLIVREASAILDCAIEEAEGDLGEAMVVAVAKGYLDIPFSPSIWNAGKVIAIRDSSNAVRFADFGGIPFPPDIKEYHQVLVQKRLTQEGRNLEELVEQDVLYFQSKEYASA